MNKTFSRLLVSVGLLILLYLSISLVASISQLASAADRVHMGFGQPVFWTFISLYLFLLLSPLYLYFKLPKALIPPVETSGSKYDKYFEQLRKRLSSNPRLNGLPMQTHSDLESAMALLSKDADKVVRDTATAVFVGTAIMQNGKLDGLITLATQARMVWRIACVYQQRPSPREMIYLYSNVASNALLAESVLDIDLSEIIAPLFSSSLASAIPGASLVVNSITNGASNAFLTLRIGIITRQYCEALSTPVRGVVRRNATLAAVAMVGSIVKENSSRIVSGSFSILKVKANDAVDSTIKGASFVATKVSTSVASGAKSIGNTVNATTDTVSNSLISGAKSVGNAMSFTAEKVSVSVTTGGRSIGNAVSSATSMVSDSLVTGVQSIGKSGGNTAEKVSVSVTSGGKFIGNSVGAVIEGTKQITQKLHFRKNTPEI